MKEHSKEDVRLGRIVFLACIVVAMLAVTFCRGQNQRYDRFDDRDDIITISPEKSMKLPYKGKDIAVSVFVDSLSDGGVYVFMYAYLPDIIKEHDNPVTIKFDNDVIETLYPTSVDTMYEGYTYVEYFVPGKMYRNFVDHKFLYINFEGIKQFIAISQKACFFKDFFAEFSGKTK